MTFRRDAELSHWKNDPLKKISILKNDVVDGINIHEFEIRQYTHYCSFRRNHTIYTIYMKTNGNEIETKYNQGIQVTDNNIENIAQSIINLNGVYSTINRLLIELENS
jgi:hypothetical protein